MRINKIYLLYIAVAIAILLSVAMNIDAAMPACKKAEIAAGACWGG